MSDDVPSIESLLKEVRRRGLRVNNLFHMNCGLWQCNLRSTGAAMQFFEFGRGPDAPGALVAALEKMAAGKYVPAKQSADADLDPAVIGHARHDLPQASAATTDDDDLIG